MAAVGGLLTAEADGPEPVVTQYGPSWVDAAKQDGPVMILTGSEDAVTPLSWTYPVLEAIQTNGQGGLYAVLEGAGHNDLDRYQEVVLLWWQFTLNDQANAGHKVRRILDKEPWHTQDATP